MELGTVTIPAALAFGGELLVLFQHGTEEWAFTGIPPTAPAAGYSDAIVGQMYYNSTSGQFKAIKNGGAPIGTWSSMVVALNTDRDIGGVSGTSNSCICISGGRTPPKAANVEEL